MHEHAVPWYVCPFCALLDGRPGEAPTSSDVVVETPDAVAFVAPRWWPNNRGHALVVPRRHVENLYAIAEADLVAVTLLAQRVANAMRASYGCSGISTRQHNEPDGGQDVWHFHVHVIPRYPGDELYRSRALPGFQPPEERARFARILRAELE